MYYAPDVFTMRKSFQAFYAQNVIIPFTTQSLIIIRVHTALENNDQKWFSESTNENTFVHIYVLYDIIHQRSEFKN